MSVRDTIDREQEEEEDRRGDGAAARTDAGPKNALDDLTDRGLVHQITSPDARALLERPAVTCYVGFDPSAPSLHVGSLLQILLLARMQRAGHRPIALVGGATGMIGDPSGKSEERNLLAAGELERNVEGIRAQLERFLDFSPGATQALLLNNADWLAPVGLLAFLRDVGKCFSVNAMIEKDSVRTRLREREQGISYTEFTYMLLQAYDFKHLCEHHGCELQLGGSDQWGNITAGVELVRRLLDRRVFGVTSPLLTTADGRKLGKTEQGAVWLDATRTSPYQLFQYWVRTDDRDVVRLLRMLTFRSRDEIESLERETVARPEARAAQRALATDLTSLVHGGQAARDAMRASEALFGREIAELDEQLLLEVMAEAPSSSAPRSAFADPGKPLVDLLVETGLSGSRSAARNDVKGGGVYVNNARVLDPSARVSAGEVVAGRYLVLRRGKKSFHLVRLEPG